MKKIAVLLLLILGLMCIGGGGCKQNYSNHNVVINNKTNNKEMLHITTVQNERISDEYDVEIQPMQVLTISMRMYSGLFLKGVSRNFLEKISEQEYHIKETEPTVYTFYNKTSEKIKVSDRFNLFDETELGTKAHPDPGEESSIKTVNVYLYKKKQFFPVAKNNMGREMKIYHTTDKTLIIVYQP